MYMYQMSLMKMTVVFCFLLLLDVLFGPMEAEGKQSIARVKSPDEGLSCSAVMGAG